jgi:hypothetical protein
MPRKRGRPVKLTPELSAEFCAALRRCWHVETAADLVGISRASVYGWVKKGKRARKGLHADFFRQVKKALAEMATAGVTAIQLAGQTQWTAWAWLLERRYPQLWSSVVSEVREIQRWCKQQDREGARHGPAVPSENGTPGANGAGGPAAFRP